MVVSLRTQNNTIEERFLALRHFALNPLLEIRPCRFKSEFFSSDSDVLTIFKKVSRLAAIVIIMIDNAISKPSSELMLKNQFSTHFQIPHWEKLKGKARNRSEAVR